MWYYVRGLAPFLSLFFGGDFQGEGKVVIVVLLVAQQLAMIPPNVAVLGVVNWCNFHSQTKYRKCFANGNSCSVPTSDK